MPKAIRRPKKGISYRTRLGADEQLSDNNIGSGINGHADDVYRGSAGERARSVRVGGSGNGALPHASSSRADADDARHGRASVRAPGASGDADVHGSR